MKKRIVSFVLILIMVIGLMPTVALAEKATSGTCGDDAYWSFDSASGTLTISGTGKMNDYDINQFWGNNAPWQDFDTSIKRVVIKDGITNIGNGAFMNCSALETIDLPDSLTSIDTRAFYNCISLKSVTIPDNVTAIDASFTGCTNLKSVTIPNSVREIKFGAFEYCENIERVNISDISAWCNIYFDTASANPLTYGADLYMNGSPVTDIVITNGLPQSNGTVVLCQYAFYGCKSLKSVTISGDITSIGSSAFANCSNLRKIKLPAQLTKISAKTFSNSGIKVLYIPASVTSISEDAFKNTNVSYVYYGGSETDRQNTTILEGNDSLNSAAWIYNATELPAHEYDDDHDYTCNLCGEVRADTSKIFTDVVESKWYKEYVDYAYSYGFFKGTTDTTFEPNTSLTRAMFVTVLARISGETVDDNVKTKFTDVATGKWYTGSIKWANENGIVNGLSETTFGWNDKITREQMCTMLIRFADLKDITLNSVNEKTDFADDSSISSWAKDAVYACQSANIVNGSIEDGKTVFKPKGNATRAEASKILSVFHRDYL